MTPTEMRHERPRDVLAAMAKKTGAIGTLIVPGYFIPLRHAHSTYRAMTERFAFLPFAQPAF